MSSSSFFSVPWTPAINGSVLAPLQSIAELVEYDVQPDVRTAGPWSRKAFDHLLNDAPQSARESLWESVVAIWRLKEVEETSCEDPHWVDHLQAWLVSEPCDRGTSSVAN